MIGNNSVATQSGDGSLIDIYFGSIGKSIREPSPDWLPEKVIGHSERQVSNSVNCYHLFQEQEIDLDGQKYDGILYCFAKVYSNDTNALIIAATCLEDNGVLIFDKLVDTLATLGDSIYVGS